MTTIPNPLNAQHEELVIARLARDMALSELEEIATALSVRANITVTTDVADAVNELLDSWEEMAEALSDRYTEEAERFNSTSEQRIQELRERLEGHKAFMKSSPTTPDGLLHKRFGGEDGE